MPAALLELSSIKPLNKSLESAIKAVEAACEKAYAPTRNFTIDETFCDWNAPEGQVVETHSIAEIIDATAADFGGHDSANYQNIASYLCDKVCEHFAYKPTLSFTDEDILQMDKEGWRVFYIDGDESKPQIQRNDEAGKFKSDNDVYRFLFSSYLSSKTPELHTRVVEYFNYHHEEEYKRMIDILQLNALTVTN